MFKLRPQDNVVLESCHGCLQIPMHLGEKTEMRPFVASMSRSQRRYGITLPERYDRSRKAWPLCPQAGLRADRSALKRRAPRRRRPPAPSPYTTPGRAGRSSPRGRSKPRGPPPACHPRPSEASRSMSPTPFGSIAPSGTEPILPSLWNTRRAWDLFALCASTIQ